jgi:serine/threonine-protein kinase RsbW
LAPEPSPGINLLLSMSLTSDPQFFCAVRGAVERLTETLGFSPEGSRAITRAIDEALTNILRHSYSNRPDRPITVTFQKTRSGQAGEQRLGLEVVLRDEGPEIDRSKLAGRPLDEIRPGGLGLHFIHEAMDVVEFKRAGNANELRLVKYLADGPKAR